MATQTRLARCALLVLAWLALSAATGSTPAGPHLDPGELRSVLEPFHTITSADLHTFHTNRGNFIGVIGTVLYKLDPKGEIDDSSIFASCVVEQLLGPFSEDPIKIQYDSADLKYIKSWIGQHPLGKDYPPPAFAPGTTHVAAVGFPNYLIDTSGVLKGKTITAVVAMAGGSVLMQCSDGTLAAWGRNVEGQLGIGKHGAQASFAFVPVLVDTGDEMKGKKVVSIGGNTQFYFALCSDGSLYAWGGTGKLITDKPKLLNVGPYSGKKLTFVDGYWALCDDGTMTIPLDWLYHLHGDKAPQWIDQGALKGKTVTALRRFGGSFVFLCSDGTLAATDVIPGLATGAMPPPPSPFTLPDSDGVLAGKTAVQLGSFAISKIGTYSFAVYSDGTLAAWKQPAATSASAATSNRGASGTRQSTAAASAGRGAASARGTGRNPAGTAGAVARGTAAPNGQGATPPAAESVLHPFVLSGTGVLQGKTITGFYVGNQVNQIVCSDGSLATWDGKNPPTESNADPKGLLHGKKILFIQEGHILFEELDPAKESANLSAASAGTTPGQVAPSDSNATPTTVVPTP